MKKAIILAGGEGTRLRPVTYEIPKPLIPVKKKPVIDHVIEFLARYGFSEIAVVISAKHKDDFETWKKHRMGLTPVSLFMEKRPAGTFGCLRFMKDWIGNESFVVANGDCLVDCDLGEVITLHNAYKPVLTEPLVKVCTSGNYGVPVMDGIFLAKFSRKDVVAGGEFICGGPHIFEPTIFDYDDSDKALLNIEELFPRLIEHKKILGLRRESGRFFDCGTLESWERAIKEW